MGDSLFARLLKAIFRLLWKLFLNTIYIIGKFIELILIQFNNLIKSYI